MKWIKAGAAVLNQTPLDWDGNLARIVGAIQQARAQQVSLLCMPELCISGYGCEDAFHSPGLQRTVGEILLEIVPQTQGMMVSVGLPMMVGGGLFNTACMMADGQILGFVAKQNLAGEGIHYEQRWFKAWPEGARTEVELEGRVYPLGDYMFDCGGIRIGFEICEDAWTATRPGTELSLHGVDIILNPSASHFAFGKHEVRRRLVLEGSRAFHVSYIYSNLLGNEAGRAIYDGDALIASAGRILASGPRFSYADFHIVTATFDVDVTRMQRSRSGSFRPDVSVDGSGLVRSEIEFPVVEPEAPQPDLTNWETGQAVKEEEFSRAISLGLFDYLRKSRSQGFVVSLSGGADSSAVTTLIGLMVSFGSQELGLEDFLEKLGINALDRNIQDPLAVVHQILTCVYQPTRNSSETTRNAALEVAEAWGARFLEFDVDEIVQNYISTVSQALGRDLSWEQDDIALQNIQARSRSPSVWLLANLQGALLVSTSNRSEAAVGYATMDGDTSGGLSPIAGIDKAFLRHWLCWIEKEGPEGIGAVPALAGVNVQLPTAELRPQDAHQTDEDDLMPYDLLDAIERAAIRDKLTPVEILRLFQARDSQYSTEQLSQWIERFFRLWCRNQWKRERYAPSFHLDDENLDPKTWCRFPILSGGFERELRALRESVVALSSGQAQS